MTVKDIFLHCCNIQPEADFEFYVDFNSFFINHDKPVETYKYRAIRTGIRDAEVWRFEICDNGRRVRVLLLPD